MGYKHVGIVHHMIDQTTIVDATADTTVSHKRIKQSMLANGKLLMMNS